MVLGGSWSDGHAYRWRGGAWKRINLPANADHQASLRGAWGSGDDRVFISGTGELLGYDGVSWGKVTPPLKGNADYGQLWGAGTALFVTAWEQGLRSSLWRGICSR